jgi:hypothetical protein
LEKKGLVVVAQFGPFRVKGWMMGLVREKRKLKHH